MAGKKTVSNKKTRGDMIDQFIYAVSRMYVGALISESKKTVKRQKRNVITKADIVRASSSITVPF